MSSPNATTPTTNAKVPAPVVPSTGNNNMPIKRQRKIASLALTKPGMTFAGLVKNDKGYDVVQFRIIPPEIKKNARRKRPLPINNMPRRMNTGGNVNTDPCKRRLVRQALTMQGVTNVQRMRFLRQIGCNIPRQMHQARRGMS